MRRLVGLTVLLFTLAVPAVAFAFVADDNDGTLSVKAGVGRVNVNFSGAAVGRLGHGRITANDPVPSDGAGVLFWGCSKLRDTSASTTICSGDNIRFRAIGGKYVILVRGSGIYLSVVGHGTVAIDGGGGNPLVADGVYSLNDKPYRSLPNSLTVFTLAAPLGS
jgi:hypothetical protein